METIFFNINLVSAQQLVDHTESKAVKSIFWAFLFIFFISSFPLGLFKWRYLGARMTNFNTWLTQSGQRRQKWCCNMMRFPAGRCNRTTEKYLTATSAPSSVFGFQSQMMGWANLHYGYCHTPFVEPAYLVKQSVMWSIKLLHSEMKRSTVKCSVLQWSVAFYSEV